MSEKTSIKLNLQAFKEPEKVPPVKKALEKIEVKSEGETQNSNHDISSKENIQNIHKNKKNIISIGMIQNRSHNNLKKLDTTEEKGQKESQDEVYKNRKSEHSSNNQNSKTNTSEKIEQKSTHNLVKKTSIVSPQGNKTHNNSNKIKKESEKDIQKEGETEKKIEFKNYVSTFEKESKNVFKKIRNFRYAPKTNIGFIIFLIGMTILTIGMLMVFFPEKHSFKIYKASIMEITHTHHPQKHEIPQHVSHPIPQEITPINTPLEESHSGSHDELNSDEGKETNNISQQDRQKELLKNHLLRKYSQ